MIDAQRGFADPDSSEGTEKVRKQLSAQMRNYYEKHLDPEKAPSPEDLTYLMYLGIQIRPTNLLHVICNQPIVICFLLMQQFWSKV